MRRLGALLLAAATSLGGGGAQDAVDRLEAERIALADRLAKSVCAVFRGPGGGSGVIITPDGLVLSNFHVTELDAEMRIGLDDHRIHRAAVLGVDPSGDVSLLRLVEKREWPFTPLGDSDALRQGDWVYAMGNPFLLATDFTPTVTLGVVSGIHRYQPGSIRGTLLYPDCIQTDASINPGNSGGPLFSFRGEVVGINGRVSLRDRGRVNIGVGYAISSNQVAYCMPELRAGKVVEHGTLNATVRDIDDPDWPGGVRITFDQLLDPGCAHAAGIRLGDALVSFRGQRLEGTNDFLRMISVLPKGRRVELRVATGGENGWEERDLRITLDGIPLIKQSDLVKRRTPQVYLDEEVDRTFRAAAAALAPVAAETRKGTLEVRGREPEPLEERYEEGAVRVTAGDLVRDTRDAALDADTRADLLERVRAWNDLVRADARQGFAKVDFTGGALVGGTTADRIEVETPDGAKRVYFVDLRTGRLLRVDLYAAAWVRWISLFLDDWRTAGGLQRPYRVEVWDREKESLLQTLTYESIVR